MVPLAMPLDQHQEAIQTPDTIPERLQAELSLLEAMYTDSVTFNPTTSELQFKPSSSGKARAELVLRLPDGYPESGSPQVILACDNDRTDLRKEVAVAIRELSGDSPHGWTGEILDEVVHQFTELVETQQANPGVSKTPETKTPAASKTVIIWLHHLLATSKRKLALHSPSSAGLVSGVTKPGYPGIMLFTGPMQAVDEHVAELKSLNWQAFQVRYEEAREWNLLHSSDAKRVVEVETMAEVVHCIEEDRRKQFLKAVGVK